MLAAPGQEIHMKTTVIIAATTIIIAASIAACSFERPSLWELKCAACHDGKTVLNGKVVPDKEELKGRYRDIESFASSCQKAPRCMNILKHDEELFREIGREIGIPYAR
jgi:hypothetical protein